MKVLWFTNIPMPAMFQKNNESFVGTGGWMLALLDSLLEERSDIKIGVACIYPGLKTQTFKQDRITYFAISQGSPKRIFHFELLDLKKDFLHKCIDIIENYRPDIIHVHGTERPYGLLVSFKELKIPIVVSIQGLLSECSKWVYTFGDLDLISILKMHKFFRFFRGIGPFWEYIQLKKRARMEQNILKNCKFVFGRTEWDKANVMAINPNVIYYHIGEILRPEFYKNKWNIHNIVRYSIFYTNAGGPRRNLHTLYKAVALLKEWFPEIRLFLAGSPLIEYKEFLLKLAKKLNIENQVTFLGRLNAKEIAKYLSTSHLFVIPSLIENSPNSLCEAQLVGTPCIASYTGGIPSLVEHRKTGLLFSPYDSNLLANYIVEIFESDELAVNISKNARCVAKKRHDPKNVVENLVKAYQDIIEKYNG